MNRPIYTVCAAGAAGCAVAADIALMGYRVNLFELDRFKENVEQIQEAGGIELSGKTQSGRNGFAKLSKVTTDPEEAAKDADLIMICAPAFGHETFVGALSPHLSRGQCLMINTGYWASLRCLNLLRKEGALDRITLAEANIMPYMAEKKGNQVHILNVKKDIRLATFPGNENDRIFEIVNLVYPQHKRMPNVLWTNLGPGNPSVHPTVLLPIAAIPFERYRGCKVYGEATTLAARLIDAFDKERIRVCQALGCSEETSVEWFGKTYGYTGRDFGEALRKSPHADGYSSREVLQQLLSEDLGYFYVPVSRLAESLGIPTPLITGIIHVMGVMLDTNYWDNGLTLEELGFSGLTADQIVNYVNTGQK